MQKLKIKKGLVVSSAMNKSIVVKVETRYKHKLYKRTLKKSKKYIVHDEKNECSVGDMVEIAECRPLSKRKYFRIYKRNIVE